MSIGHASTEALSALTAVRASAVFDRSCDTPPREVGAFTIPVIARGPR